AGPDRSRDGDRHRAGPPAWPRREPDSRPARAPRRATARSGRARCPGRAEFPPQSYLQIRWSTHFGCHLSGGFAPDRRSSWLLCGRCRLVVGVCNTGAGHSITAVGVNQASYVAWCGPCNTAGFARGIATNYGGTWHALSLPAAFPNRFIQAITVDPADKAHAYVVFNGFSRRWTNTFSA